ncbi:hypothetical protein M758_8G084100 [Ceratodon purpureus]|nr:hypothetical protein M758_8G084100 [Ceratodon purpureus]
MCIYAIESIFVSSQRSGLDPPRSEFGKQSSLPLHLTAPRAMGLNDSSGSLLNFHVTSESVSLLTYFVSRVSTLEWCVTLVSAFLVWLWWYRHAQSKVAGPKRWPLIGSTFELVANWDRMHDWLREQFSNEQKTILLAFAAHLGDAVYTVDPANVEYVLKTNFANYPKGEMQCNLVRELFGVGIFTTDGDLWKEQRRVSSYEFSSRTLREFSTDVFREYGVKLVLHLARFAESTQAFDLQDLCMRMTLDTTCRIGFGVEQGCLAPSLPNVPFSQCFDEVNYISFHRFIDPLWKFKRALNIGSERRLKECVKTLDDFTYDVIGNKRQKITSSTNKDEKGADLLSRFTDLCKNGEKQIGKMYTDTALRDMILNFIIAGRDTTAATLSWFFYMMTCHPDVGDKIVEELYTVTQQPAADHQHTHPAGSPAEETIEEFSKLLTYETLGNLHYLHAALSETLRLFPAVSADAKQAAHDDVLPDGTVVKKGDMVGYVPYSMGRLTSLWGDDALDFKPGRWLGKNGHFEPQPLFKFTAFQAGPRTCLGKDSAYLQMKMTAALAMRFFSFHLVPGHPVQYQTMLILHMLHGLQVTVTPR